MDMPPIWVFVVVALALATGMLFVFPEQGAKIRQLWPRSKQALHQWQESVRQAGIRRRALREQERAVQKQRQEEQRQERFERMNRQWVEDEARLRAEARIRVQERERREHVLEEERQKRQALRREAEVIKYRKKGMSEAEAVKLVGDIDRLGSQRAPSMARRLTSPGTLPVYFGALMVVVGATALLAPPPQPMSSAEFRARKAYTGVDVENITWERSGGGWVVRYQVVGERLLTVTGVRFRTSTLRNERETIPGQKPVWPWPLMGLGILVIGTTITLASRRPLAGVRTLGAGKTTATGNRFSIWWYALPFFLGLPGALLAWILMGDDAAPRDQVSVWTIGALASVPLVAVFALLSP